MTDATGTKSKPGTKRGLRVRKPRTSGQWLWLMACIGWVVVALWVVVWTTLWLRGGPDGINDEFYLLGQLLVAAPASWIVLTPAFFLPQQPIGPDGGGGVGGDWAFALQVLTGVLVVIQGYLVYLVGPRGPRVSLVRAELPVGSA